MEDKEDMVTIWSDICSARIEDRLCWCVTRITLSVTLGDSSTEPSHLQRLQSLSEPELQFSLLYVVFRTFQQEGEIIFQPYLLKDNFYEETPI